MTDYYVNEIKDFSYQEIDNTLEALIDMRIVHRDLPNEAFVRMKVVIDCENFMQSHKEVKIESDQNLDVGDLDLRVIVKDFIEDEYFNRL